MATGSELSMAVDAAKDLEKEGKKVRVVSMPCWELFEEQTQEYRDSVLPPACKARVSVEAGSTFGWAKWTGDHGKCIGIDTFGASAPANILYEKFGITQAAVVAGAFPALLPASSPTEPLVVRIRHRSATKADCTVSSCSRSCSRVAQERRQVNGVPLRAAAAGSCSPGRQNY